MTVEELDAVGGGAWYEPLLATTDTPSNDAHAALHFDGLGSKRRDKAGRDLKIKALARGRLYP